MSTVSTAGIAAEESHRYLDDMLDLLRRIHARYYEELDAATAAAASPPASFAGAPPASTPRLPRTDDIISQLMSSVLDGVGIVFSGVFPQNVCASKTPLWRRAAAFGAELLDAVSATQLLQPSSSSSSCGHPPEPPPSGGAATTTDPSSRPPLVTHVVARVGGTAKVAEARTAGDVRIVGLGWLEESLKR
jgi:hypothetical protein